MIDTNKWVTKKTVLFMAIVAFVSVFILNNPLMFGFCKNIREATTFNTKLCMDGSVLPEAVSLLGLYLSVTIFFLSLITYKMRDEIFHTWLKFAYWCVPLTIVLTLLTPGGRGGWGIPSLIDPETVSFVFSALFALISSIIILVKYFKLRRKQ